jgi:hypothetical protein
VARRTRVGLGCRVVVVWRERRGRTRGRGIEGHMYHPSFLS